MTAREHQPALAVLADDQPDRKRSTFGGLARNLPGLMLGRRRDDVLRGRPTSLTIEQQAMQLIEASSSHPFNLTVD